MSYPIDESSMFTSQHLYQAALLFTVVRWIITSILKLFDSKSEKSSSISVQMIRDSLELTKYGDLSAAAFDCDEPCAVCLNRMEEEDAVRRLKCCHVFHAECLDKWIEYGRVTCPLCRCPLMDFEDGLHVGPFKLEIN